MRNVEVSPHPFLAQGGKAKDFFYLGLLLNIYNCFDYLISVQGATGTEKKTPNLMMLMKIICLREKSSDFSLGSNKSCSDHEMQLPNCTFMT